jgi:selenide,water dikinase
MGPEALAQVLRPLAGIFDSESYPDLLQGLDTPDDAAVWRLDDERALVLTADFFPPVVDDPYDFGAIAAANSLSDLYAMGAEPLMGINLVGYPEDLDTSILSEILRGGAEKLREAGAVIAGGHTTSDKEPKYGVAATGLVHPKKILTKGGAHPGDVLFLSKPIGTGVVTTAHKRGQVDAGDLETAVASMARLSRGAAAILRRFDGDIHAATDITGFSLAGHGHEMAHQSGLTLRLAWDTIPRLPGSENYARTGSVPGGGKRNRLYYGPWVSVRRALEEWEQILLYDPQTSGGLLFAAAPERADDIERVFRENEEPLWRVGETVAERAGGLEIV